MRLSTSYILLRIALPSIALILSILSAWNKKVHKPKQYVGSNAILKKLVPILWDFQVTIFICIFIITVSKTILLSGHIPSGSMEPTFEVNDWVIANSLSYVTNVPMRGDIIVFKSAEGDHTDDLFCKRIIGLPGDTVSFIDGDVYINGTQLDDYTDINIKTYSYVESFSVPKNSYFVMGDNRLESFDSRFWENPYVDFSAIMGKIIVRIPISKLFCHHLRP